MSLRSDLSFQSLEATLAPESQEASHLPILPPATLTRRVFPLPFVPSYSATSRRLHQRRQRWHLPLLRSNYQNCCAAIETAVTSGGENDGFRRCPHCREVNTTPTKYWIGGLSGPREPAYSYPARTPQMHPPPLKTPGDRPSSTKRQLPGDSPSPSPTQNKKPRNSQHQQQATPIKTLCVAETARMERKDSVQSTPATPAASKTEPSLDTEVLNTLAAWKACKGCPDVHLQKELKDAEENLRMVRESIPRIDRKVKETQRELDAAGAFLKQMEQLSEDIDKAVAKAGGLNEGKHKIVKDEWYLRPKKHGQLAYEENNRCSKSWEKAVQDRADATRLENEVKQKIERIHEERKQLKKFGEYVSVLPSSTNA